MEPAGVTTAASILSRGSVTPGLSPGMAKVLMFRAPKRTARAATTITSPEGARPRPCASSTETPAPIFPSGENGIALFTLSEAIQSVRFGGHEQAPHVLQGVSRAHRVGGIEGEGRGRGAEQAIERGDAVEGARGPLAVRPAVADLLELLHRALRVAGECQAWPTSNCAAGATSLVGCSRATRRAASAASASFPRAALHQRGGVERARHPLAPRVEALDARELGQRLVELGLAPPRARG